MEIPESSRRLQDLRLDTGKRGSAIGPQHDGGDGGHDYLSYPPARQSHPSEETIRATPPIDIPIPNEQAVADDVEGQGSSDRSSIEEYLRARQPSISFNNEVSLDSGQRQNIDEPLERPAKTRQRGRSILQAIADERQKAARAHSESHREHYDPITGRHLPQYSITPPREQARFGEQRFPLLQATVDDLARESQPDLPHTMSMTSESTMSPISDQVRTPRDEPVGYLMFPTLQASSYEEPKEFKRTASQRWRDGQHSASDFFSRAGSIRKSSSEARRLARHNTSGSVRSPNSAASSFLRGFSISSGGDDNDGPAAFDAEGQTIGENYVLGKQIGYGGFSVIKEVTQMQESGAQRKLAAKIVRRNIEDKSEHDNEHVQAEFEHEVELWRFLSHSRILPLEAVYKTDEATFCLIPLNTGGTLFDLVRNNRQGLPLHLAQRYTYQLASALRYLHSDARVAHRDVKLENVLLDTSTDEAGNIRLCDFGMAEWISNDNVSGPPSPRLNATDRPPQKNIGPADTSTSAFAGGSLEYAAPEILKIAESTLDSNSERERGIVSPAVDVWALGVCVYTMVVGRRPFSNSFQPRVMMAILAGDWDRELLKSKGGQEVLELVEGCLEMDVAHRFTIQDVLNCAWLRDVVNEEEEMQGPGGSGWRL